MASIRPGMRARLRRGVRLLPTSLAVVVVLLGAATAQTGWDGTWAGGWEHGDGVQIIVAGGKVIGVFRGGDYPEVQRSQILPDGRTLIFAWTGGDGRLQRTAERDAAFTLHEPGKAERSFIVHRE